MDTRVALSTIVIACRPLYALTLRLTLILTPTLTLTLTLTGHRVPVGKLSAAPRSLLSH